MNFLIISDILLKCILLLLLGIICVLVSFYNYNYNYKIEIIRNIAIYFSLLVFILSLIFYIILKVFIGLKFGHQLDLKGIIFQMNNIEISYGIDGISIWFLILTTFIIMLVIFLSLDQINHSVIIFYILIFLLEFSLISCFIVNNLFWFCVFFEMASIPVFKIIILYGSVKYKRILAGYQFFIYTYIGSIILFFTIFFIHIKIGSLEYYQLLKWVEIVFSKQEQCVLWLLLAISFGIKVPLMPLHKWLPEAHVEAPTVGSVILAGLVMKLGGYAFFRYLISIFNITSIFFSTIVQLICLFSIVFCMLVSFRQLDLKKAIAFLSIAHMNVSILGLLTNNFCGFEGGIMLMYSHGLISSGLFICVGFLYDRYKTRNIMDFGGLVHISPVFSSIFFIFILSNIAFPASSIFIGEFLSMLGIFIDNTFIGIFIGFCNAIMSIYSLWLYGRVCYGRLPRFSKFGVDIEIKDNLFYCLILLLILNVIFGLIPNIILNDIYFSIMCILY